MKLPKHAQVLKDRIMQAPYNFVPLPEAAFTVDHKLPDHDVYCVDHRTGYIELDIETETLLYTRCAYPPQFADQEVHRTPEKQNFFHHGDPQQPVIPGSSLRGMLRTLVEILGFARMTHVYDDRLIYRAVGDTTSLGIKYREKMLGSGDPLPYPSFQLKGGYLRKENGQWYIQPALEHHSESFIHTRNYPAFALAHPEREEYSREDDIILVWVVPPRSRRKRRRTRSDRPSLFLADVSDEKIQPRNDDLPPGSEWVKGTLVKSGHISVKHMHCVIYDGNPDRNRWIPVSDSLRQLYEKDRDQKRGIPCRLLGKDRELLQEGDPLFYFLDPDKKSNENPYGLFFFGPTMMFRIPYDRSILQFIPDFLREEKNKKMDLAESIFGTTSRKGRVRFCDAELTSVNDGGSPFLDSTHQGRIIPRILSSPKPTAFQNYLVQPIDVADHPKIYAKQELLLHYDYPYKEDGQYRLPITKETVTTDGTVIRGHKQYWNKPENEENVREAGQLVEMDDQGLCRFRLAPDREDWVDATEKTPQHSVIRPVRPGCHFQSRIYFENLSDIELGALLVALQLRDENSRHRLGMGKPYGIGRVRITHRIFLEDRKNRYGSLNIKPFCEDIDIQHKIDAFTRKIKVHHQKNYVGKAVESIWEIPRLEALALLLDKDGPSSDEAKEYVPITPKYNRKKWQQRYVLPTPHQVMGFPTDAPKEAKKKIAKISNGDSVACIVLKERTKKGKWRLRVKDGNGVGCFHPQSKEPPNIAPGKEYTLRVVSNDPRNMSFIWEP